MTALSYGVPAGELSLDLLLKEDEQVEVVRDLPQTLAAPVRQGQQVGCVPVSAERPGAERVSGVCRKNGGGKGFCLVSAEGRVENYRL